MPFLECSTVGRGTLNKTGSTSSRPSIPQGRSLFVIISTCFPQNFLFSRRFVNWKCCPWKESRVIEALHNGMTLALILWIRLCFPLTEHFPQEGKLEIFRKDLYFISQPLCECVCVWESSGSFGLPFPVATVDGDSPPPKDFPSPLPALFCC